ncbi:MAG: hypothetical protein MZU97_15470 [Bacillus subtilis]|nr:hypothetical protein [Bacillus subtilis]
MMSPRFLYSNPWVQDYALPIIVIALLIYDLVPAVIGLIRRTIQRNPDSIFYYGLHKTMMYVAYVVIGFSARSDSNSYVFLLMTYTSTFAAVIVYYFFRWMVKRPMNDLIQPIEPASDAVPDVTSK